MSLTEAQVQFAAEFVTLVVTASALALLVLRPPDRNSAPPAPAPARPPRPLLPAVVAAVALMVLGAASFVHGSLLVSGPSVTWLGLGRLVAAGSLILAFPYPGGPRAGRTPVGGVLLRLGFLGWLVAGAAELATAPAYLIDALLVAGSLLTAGALLQIAQRYIAVRVAGSGAATLLLVVIVLALALSTVISSSVQRDELNRLSARVGVEKAAVSDADPLAFTARLVEADLASYFTQPGRNPLYEFAHGAPADRSAAAQAIGKRLSQLNGSAGDRPFGTIRYSAPDGTQILVPGGSAGAAPGPGADPALDVRCSAPVGTRGVFETASPAQVEVAASLPECTATSQLLGVVSIIRILDSGYLSSRQPLDPSVSLALVAGPRVVATAGVPPGLARSAVRVAAGGDGQATARVLGNSFVSVAPLAVVTPAGTRTAYLVAATPATSVLSAREQLFRTLFLIAFGGTVLALGLAVFTGDRITAGLRRLTGAATAIQAGESAVRAGVRGEDEVATLGSAFDSMLDSVAAQAAALHAAAEDEARLRDRLEAVVAGMNDALVAVDIEGRITDFNRAAVELTGVDARKAVGAPVERIIRFRTDDGPPVGPPLFRPGERDQAVVSRLVRPGSDVPVAVSSGALRGPGGEPAGTVLVLRDMSKEHEVEQMKTDFLSRVGHELRTPLTGILGYSDILLRREVPAERARSWHEEILQSARRLLRIVEMLEFFASDSAGRLVLRPEPLDVRSLVNGIVSSWSGRLPANVTLGRRMCRAEAVVHADRRWLSLAVDELMDNAVKFSPEGGRIVVRVADHPGSVEISVSDQGMGMTAQQYEVVFGEFVQADNSDTRRFGGLGLGLAVVRRVVEGHGGTVRGRSAPGRGTTFVIELPAGPSPTRAGAAS